MMTLFGRVLRALLACSLLLTSASPAAAGSANQRVISNTARVSWEIGGTVVERTSNRVDLVVAESSSVIDVFVPTDGLPPTLMNASCLTDGAPLDIASLAQAFGTLAVQSVESLSAGQPLVLELSRPSKNVDPEGIDSFAAFVETSTGDREQLTFVETSNDGGRFKAVVATKSMPPEAVRGDCRLSVQRGSPLVLDLKDDLSGSGLVTKTLDVLVDEFGTVFDSTDGAPISEVQVTLINVSTGLPAQVFGRDGVSSFPATVVTGHTVVDSSGNAYPHNSGTYGFPVVPPGTYRLKVEPVSPYSFPSVAAPSDLASLRRQDGKGFALDGGSFGDAITVAAQRSIRMDVPLDRPRSALVLAKSASIATAQIGDLVQYRVSIRNTNDVSTGKVTAIDRIPEQMRYRTGSARLNGLNINDPTLSAGRTLLFALPSIAGRAEAILTYLLEVKPDARAGDALNQVQASTVSGVMSNIADAHVRIRSDEISGRLNIIGRISEGGCSARGAIRRGVSGLRVMLEDGSYAVTDREGRYHFEGVSSGTHVVQIDRSTLGTWKPVDCGANVRSGGRAFSRFVDGAGGLLKRVDFFVERGAAKIEATHVGARSLAVSDAEAAGSKTDYLAGQAPGIDWLFPAVDQNPRAPVIRVVIKHAPGQMVRLYADEKAVDPLNFEGVRKNEAGGVAVSEWRGIPLSGQRTDLKGDVVSADGAIVKTLRRRVTFSDVAARAELLKGKSRLVADGVQRPIIAIRLTDRDGRPVHHGTAGDFELPAPYLAAMEADAQQARQLSGLDRARPTWRVDGDQGIAYVELEPTTASGSVTLRLTFRDGENVREQRLEAWLDPGQRPWTVVGLAEGTMGYARLDKNMERLGRQHDASIKDGRLALYAKGRVKGRWLLTLAYDSDKKESETQFGGVIDPDAYYTIYADRSERRYDASSIRKLYLKLERPQFYALFGDYDTGFDEPELTRYVRSLNGVKTEYRSDTVSIAAFAADTPLAHGRDEIQGNGLSGPYVLSARDILANSERVALEVRDRFRSGRILESRLLTRHIDYDIDYRSGTLRFREPILSRDSSLNPQFIVADYEVDGIASRTVNVGARAALRSQDQRMQIAATALHDADNLRKSDVVGVDARIQIGSSTEVRGEAASSRSDGEWQKAWLIEAEHHTGSVDVLAYAQQRDSGFGINQLNRSESGTRKFGADARVRLDETLSIIGNAWHEEYLDRGTSRIAGRALLERRTQDLSARAGFTFARDELSDGREAQSSIVELGLSKRLLGNRLELDGQTQFAVGGQDQSVDFPARHRLSARMTVNPAVTMVGTYEIAHGENIDARSARLGFEVAPWAGARVALDGNVQDIDELGRRTFAAFGLAQSVPLSKHWSADVTFDGNKTLSGISPADVINPLHPVASGGYVGDGSMLTEDFAALTSGVTYRSERWSITARAEYRNGERDNRYGIIVGALRQIGEGRAFGAAVDWLQASAADGAKTGIASARLSWAHRPGGSSISFLNKSEFRVDQVQNATASSRAPFGGSLLVSGNARSARVTNSLALNYLQPNNRVEFSLFWGSRWVSERFDHYDVAGWSNLVAADLRFSLGELVEVGAAASVRHSMGGSAVAWSAGPQIGFKPMTNGWLMLGWNIGGYGDRDFAEERYTRDGPYVAMRFKFDELTLGSLGLGRR